MMLGIITIVVCLTLIAMAIACLLQAHKDRMNKPLTRWRRTKQDGVWEFCDCGKSTCKVCNQQREL